MLFIIEGPDGSGKTTLARELARVTGGHYRHSGPPTRHPLVEYSDLVDYRPGGTSLVLDRWHLGELVYGPLYRGRSGLSNANFVDLEAYLDSLGAVVVYCTASLSKLIARLEARGEKVDAADLGTECVYWDDIIRARTRLPVIVHNEWSSIDQTLDAAIAAAWSRECARR